MAETTGISWTDATFNPWIGCTKVSPGCDHCYAEVSTPARTMRINWGPQAERKRTSASNWNLPIRWNISHDQFFAIHGRRRRVFCASLADVFDNQVHQAWREDLWSLVRCTPNIDWLILTKRVGNISSMLPKDWGAGYENVWLGISIVNQLEANRDVPKLLSIPASLRWLSMEPLLEPVTLSSLLSPPINKAIEANQIPSISWVVVGGESGPHFRPIEPNWVDVLREECALLDAAFYFKQWGGNKKDKGGCTLDGNEVKAWPSTTKTIFIAEG